MTVFRKQVHTQTTHIVPVNHQVTRTIYMSVSGKQLRTQTTHVVPDRDDLHVSVRETAAYSNHSCCPSESPSDRDPSRDSVRETAACTQLDTVTTNIVFLYPQENWGKDLSNSFFDIHNFLFLFLQANTYNVELSCPGKLEEAMDKLEVRLLSTKRHYEELAEYQAPSLASTQ